MPELAINSSALEPLFKPWEEPRFHRVRAEKDGEPAQVKNVRRPSPIVIAQHLRHALSDWRRDGYPGASDTTRELLNYWFERSHLARDRDGTHVPFRYYFCQREAVEALIYLVEVRSLRRLAEVTEEFGGDDREIAAMGIDPAEDLWAKYAFKVATGAGKTKIMSLALVWSYFHALRESDSPMAKHFVMVAPNLTVFERLKEDFADGRIFSADPLIPDHWRGDWNMSIVLQDEASGAATGGVLYLTNIHRLYDPSKRQQRAEDENYAWAGPAVSRAKALDTGEALRERVTSHQRILVFNDEAHHVWDPDSAWNDALRFLNDEIQKKSGAGIVAQLDFSATPKDNYGNIFKHVVCDTPLGEAVDAGIVKTPIIGTGGKMTVRAHRNAAYKYEAHLKLGYERWLKSHQEWKKSGKKALLFVMAGDTEAADDIAQRLNSDPVFKELNGKTINLHTNLKGKVKKVGRGPDAQIEFVPNEKEISDEDLKALRELSRQLDQDPQYRCIVSVLMLREGWDVRNVTTIVPLRPLTSKADILPEQTLGRGLRRMTHPGSEVSVAETVTVVEHAAFSRLYRDELAQQGVPVEVVDVDKVPATTVTIYPDPRKDFAKLDLAIPHLSPGYSMVAKIEGLTYEDVLKSFTKSGSKPLPLGQKQAPEIAYEGRTLITNELVEKMSIKLALLDNGVGALGFFREEIELAVGIRGTHAQLAPLIQRFLEEALFTDKASLDDQRLVARLGDDDVRETIRAVFLPVVRDKVTKVQNRVKDAETASVSSWKPYQATTSERHPTIPAARTVFNLVPCNRQLEVSLAKFLDKASDVAAFVKNAGPQAIRIDYLAGGGRLAFYTPDFLVRLTDGNCLLVESKGRQDRDVPAKARAAVAWCKAASEGKKGPTWSYIYLLQEVFERVTQNEMGQVARACESALTDLLREADKPAEMLLPFEQIEAAHREETVFDFLPKADFDKLPQRYQKAVKDAITGFQFWAKQESPPFGSVFQPLLGPFDEAASALIIESLEDAIPVAQQEQDVFFRPHLGHVAEKVGTYYGDFAAKIQKLMVHRTKLMPLGLLAFCLDYARKPQPGVGGVLAAVGKAFSPLARGGLPGIVSRIKDFRNTYVAHAEKPLTDAKMAEEELRFWIKGLRELARIRHG